MEYSAFDIDDLIDGLESTPPAPDPAPDPIDNEPDPVVTEDPPVNDDPPEADPQITAYFEYLRDNEALNLPEDFEFNGTEDQLRKALEITRERNLTSAKDELNSKLKGDFKDLLEYALKGNTSARDYLDAYNEIDYDQFDLDDVMHQKSIIYHYFKQTSNYTDEKIAKLIERFDETELREEAETTVDELKQMAQERKQALLTQADQEKQAAETARQENTDRLTNVIESNKSFDTSRKERLKTFLFVPVNDGQTSSTQFARTMSQIASNDEHLVQLADLLADYNPKSGFTFDRIKKNLKSDTNKNFKQYLNEKTDPTSARGNNTRQVVNDLKWDDYFN